MDPWASVDTTPQSSDKSGSSADTREGFGDTFVDNFCDKTEKVTFEKLPDSEEYLKLLESKLQKLTAGKPKCSEESKKFRQTLVGDLARVRESTIANFVTQCDSQNAESEADIDLERSVIIHPVIRRLVPEQPLSAGEQVVLTRADQLQIRAETSDTEPDPTSSTTESASL